MNRAATAIEQHPTGAFLAFLALHAVVWTVVPTLVNLNLPLDLIEALTYGREWQLGYDKLPPLPWWMVEATYRLFGADFFFYALAQVAILAAFAVVWAMARPLVGATGALAAVLIIDGLHYFNFTSPKFNHDVLQLPFWALAGYAYWAALRGGRTVHWVLLGLAIGLAFWAKYFVAVLAAPMAVFLVFDRQARRALATPGPWLAAAVALVVMAPHLVWLVQNDFLPFAYAEARARPFKRALDYFYKPPRFLLSQLWFLVPSLMIAGCYLRRDVTVPERAAVTGDAFDRRIVALLAFGPVVAVVLLSLVSGREAVPLWGYPLWLFLGLWIVLFARPLERITLLRMVLTWTLVLVCYVAAFVYHDALRPRLNAVDTAVIFPGDRLSAELTRRYRAATGQPLRYVIARMWVGGNVSHYSPQRPRVLIEGNPRRAPWIDLDDLKKRGAIAVWFFENDRDLVLPATRANIGEVEMQPSFTLPFRRGKAVLTVHWAILRPQAVAGGR